MPQSHGDTEDNVARMLLRCVAGQALYLSRQGRQEYRRLSQMCIAFFALSAVLLPLLELGSAPRCPCHQVQCLCNSLNTSGTRRVLYSR